MLRSMVTTGGLAVAGDLIAQTIQKVKKKETAESGLMPDLSRTARMGSFGFFYYGPLNGVWYPFLDKYFPIDRAAAMAANLPSFLAKVSLNQIVLGPLVVAGVFSWTLAIQGKPEKIVQKIRDDAFSTLKTGWKFWIPASMINFWVVPLPYQVLYMSCCATVWNAILSSVTA